MSVHTQAIVLNGIPLLVLSALYCAVTAVLAPIAVRERGRATTLELAFLSMFPVIGVLAALFGAVVIADEKPFGGHLWFAFASIVIAALPPVAVLARWNERQRLIDGWLRSRETEQRVAFVDRELGSVASVSRELSRAEDAESVARALLSQVASLLSVDVTVLVLVDEDRREAWGVLGLSGNDELEWARELRLDLDAEPSGIARAADERRSVPVEDAETSPMVSRKLVERSGVKSVIFVPLLGPDAVTGVLVAGTTKRQRLFGTDELALLQAVAAEGALALDRVRSSAQLADALERERLVARISRNVRSELDLDSVLDVAVSETGRALGVARCFIRLGDPDGPMPIQAEWNAPGVDSVVGRAERLPASELAARRCATVAIGDVSSASELDEPSLGGRNVLLEIGVRSVLATPIVVFDRTIGVFALHCTELYEWSAENLELAEAVAREVGLAVHTARLLQESQERLDRLSALIKAAQVVSAELRIETVLERLVVELASLLGADAADCYLHDPAKRTLRCAAVYGLDPSLVGFEAPDDAGLAGEALQGRRSILSHEYGALSDSFPHPAYEGFTAALVAPMTGSGDVSGVLGVGTREPERRFGPTEQETIEAFARLAGLALRNAASFEERERRVRIERGFYRVASALAEPLSLAETLDALAQAASEALGGDSAAVLMPRAETLRLAGRHQLAEGVAQAFETLPPVLAECAGRGWVIASPDLPGDARFDADFRSRAGAGFESLLAVPVEAHDEERGLAIVLFAGAQSFTDDDLALAGHLADAAKGALERSELFERERRARSLSQRLARIGTLLATELDPDRVVSEVVAEAPALLAAEACAVRIVERNELVVLAAGGEGAEAVIGSRTASTTGLAGEVAQSRAPVALSAAEEQRSTPEDPLLEHGYVAYLGVPLSGPEGGLLGVLSVYSRAPRLWTTEEIEALLALAGSASAALSNAELYQQIALEKNRSDAILAHVADGIVAVDREGCVVLWNEAASRITGVEREEALGRDPADVLKRSLGAPEGVAARSRIISIPRGGEDVWLSVSEAVMRDLDGAVEGRIYAFRDISAERLVEQMKSDFVSTVSHQLRAPLTSIYGFSETLLRHDVHFSEDERKTFLRYVASESERLTTIVDTLLKVARLEAGDLDVRLGPIDLHSLLADVISSAQPPAAVNGHEFVLDLPEEPLAAEADDEKLRQVLLNLIDNAVKFSPQGGRVTVSARPKTDTGKVEVAVADEGLGIPQAEHQLIFSKFYRRADAAGQEGVGAGLGLFIAEGLVSAMGGSIRVSSVEGHGSSFVFELPLASQGLDRD